MKKYKFNWKVMEENMKTRLRESTNSICPYCALSSGSAENKTVVLNSYTGDALVECACGEQYFIVQVPDESA